MNDLSPFARVKTAPGHSERTRELLARLDRFEAIRKRADKIVDRLLPAVPQPNHSTRYGELNGTMEQYARWEARCQERARLRNAVRDRIAARNARLYAGALDRQEARLAEGRGA